MSVTELSGEKRTSDDDVPVSNGAKRQKLAGIMNSKYFLINKSSFGVKLCTLVCRLFFCSDKTKS